MEILEMYFFIDAGLYPLAAGVGRLTFTNEEVDPLSRVKMKGFRSWHVTVNCQEDNCPKLKADYFLQITSQV